MRSTLSLESKMLGRNILEKIIIIFGKNDVHVFTLIFIKHLNTFFNFFLQIFIFNFNNFLAYLLH